jgi:hypothetical protein
MNINLKKKKNIKAKRQYPLWLHQSNQDKLKLEVRPQHQRNSSSTQIQQERKNNNYKTKKIKTFESFLKGHLILI